jgi:hypothetical protein
MIAIFGDDCFHHDAIACDPFFHNARRELGHHHAAGFALPATALLALDHTHEEAYRLHVQVLAFVVADQGRLAAALLARTILTGNHLFDARQMIGKDLASRMRFALTLARCWQRLTLGFGLYFFARDAWLLVEQLQLQGAQRFAFVTVSLDTFQSQLFRERLNL